MSDEPREVCRPPHPHRWTSDGDDPLLLVCACGEVRDVPTGRVITPGRVPGVEPAPVAAAVPASFELADFNPSDGHRHLCARRGECVCAGEVYALAQKAEEAARLGVVTTVEEVEQLPPGSVVVDRHDDVWQREEVFWWTRETQPALAQRLVRWAPLTVLRRGGAR